MTHKKEKTEAQKVRNEALKKLGLIVLGVLLAVNTIQLARFGDIVERVDQYNKGVIDELGGVRQDVVMFGNDMNEIRKFLLLPTKQYAFSTEQAVENADTEEETTGSRTESAVYAFLTSVTDEQDYKKNSKLAEERVQNLSKDENLSKDLTSAGLKVGSIENNDAGSSFKITDNAGMALFAFAVDKKTTEAKLQSALGSYAVTSKDQTGTEQEIVKYAADNMQKVQQIKTLMDQQKAGVASLARNKDATDIFSSKKIGITDKPEETSDTINYYIVNSEQDHLLTLAIQRKDGLIAFGDKTYKDVNELQPAFIEALKNVDASTEQEKMIAQRKQELEAVFKEAPFQDMLKNGGYTIDTNSRLEYNKVLYDVKTADGKTAFSFAVEISSGLFKVIKDDQEIDLYSTLDTTGTGSKKKALILPTNIPDYGDKAKNIPGQLNVLVAGKHDSLVDTMIFANIDTAKRKVTLISLPRDLYYNGRKINAIYSLYGMDELKRTLSFITGYKVDKFILIDMYSFIDAIDLIGGIDVHLDEPVIDPTYKTFDGGQWGTLYYRAGDYHLSGKQALRLARTRHTSSDFARSERQHLILEALQKKAQSFGFGDAQGLTSLIENMLAKTDSDINLAEAISYYFRYQNFNVSGGHVISTGNVLDSKFTGEIKKVEQNCANVGDDQTQQKQACDNIDKGQYILLPKNNDWNSIRWYFHQIIEGKEE